MNYFEGTIIEESLENKNVLKRVKIVSTKVEKVTNKFNTPWITQWTMHLVQVPKNEARQVAEEISRSIDREHNAWYGDFKSGSHHYLIFRNKIFYVDRTSQEEYDEAKKYGLSLGIPEYQLDFHPKVEDWSKD